MNTKVSLAMMACVCLGVAGARATAYTLTVDPNLPPGTTAYVVGAVNPGAPADDASEVQYITAMIGLALGGHTTVSPTPGTTDDIYRSQNTFGSLPTPTITGDKLGTSTSITLTAGFTYLAAKYDGPNGGTEVWDLASFKAGDVITIPQNAFGNANNQYGLSGTTLLSPTGTPSVPDGGLTLVMLGSALTGLGLLRKKLS